VNYAESARKRIRMLDKDDYVSSPDNDLGGYVTTFFANDIPQETPPPLNVNPATTRSPPSQGDQQDMVELAVDSWNSHFADLARDEHHSVAAVAPVPHHANRSNEPLVTPTHPASPTIFVNGFGFSENSHHGATER
jgi:hypothetical protein